VNVPDTELPLESVTVQLTAVAPIGNTDPDAGVHVGVREPSSLSWLDVENDTLAPFGPVASCVTCFGMDNVGFVLLGFGSVIIGSF
jgi:hypothetical protein